MNCKPRVIRLPSTVRQASAGELHSLILLDDGIVFGCVDVSSGQLCLSKSNLIAKKLNFGVPVPKFNYVTAAFDWSFAISDSGQVFTKRFILNISRFFIGVVESVHQLL